MLKTQIAKKIVKKHVKPNAPNQYVSKKILAKQPRSSKAIPRLEGMRDINFTDHKYWNLLTRKAVELAEAYSFKRMETPILENLDLYKRAIEKNSSTSSFKEIYNFIDNKGKKVMLRPELTAGLARAYVDQNMEELPFPVRLFSFGPVFKQKKPNTGLHRQTHQLDLEIFGEKNPMTEALLIYIAHSFLKELNINSQVQINSLGDVDCRKEYLSKLSWFYKERKRKTSLCADCRKDLFKNPLVLLNCKDKNCKELRSEAPQIANYLSEDSKDHFEKVLEYLDELGVSYNFDPYLVRNFDYYNEIIFDFFNVTEDGNVQEKNVFVTGGRYDGLIEKIGGLSTPAVGLVIDLEKVLTKIRESNISTREPNNDLIYVAQISDQAKIKAFTIFTELKKQGFNVKQSFTTNSLKNQLEEANEIDATISLILGKKEAMDDTILFRDMESGVQEVVIQKKIVNRIEKKLKDLQNI